MKMYMIMINWSVSDSENILVKSNSIDEAHNKIKSKFPGAMINGTYLIEREI